MFLYVPSQAGFILWVERGGAGLYIYVSFDTDTLIMPHDFLDLNGQPEEPKPDKPQKQPENTAHAGPAAGGTRAETAEAAEAAKPAGAADAAKQTDSAPSQQKSADPPPAGMTPEEQRFYSMVDSAYMQALIGQGYQNYRHRWGKMFRRAGDARKMWYEASFNWASVFFGIFWAGYRGVWPLFWVHACAYMALIVNELFNGRNLMLTLIVGVTIGLFGDGFYFRMAARKASALARSNAHIAQAEADNSYKGSFVRMFLWFLIYIAVSVVFTMIAEKALQSMGYDVSIERLKQQHLQQYQRTYGNDVY